MGRRILFCLALVGVVSTASCSAVYTKYQPVKAYPGRDLPYERTAGLALANLELQAERWGNVDWTITSIDGRDQSPSGVPYSEAKLVLLSPGDHEVTVLLRAEFRKERRQPGGVKSWPKLVILPSKSLGVTGREWSESRTVHVDAKDGRVYEIQPNPAFTDERTVEVEVLNEETGKLVARLQLRGKTLMSWDPYAEDSGSWQERWTSRTGNRISNPPSWWKPR